MFDFLITWSIFELALMDDYIDIRGRIIDNDESLLTLQRSKSEVVLLFALPLHEDWEIVEEEKSDKSFPSLAGSVVVLSRDDEQVKVAENVDEIKENLLKYRIDELSAQVVALETVNENVTEQKKKALDDVERLSRDAVSLSEQVSTLKITLDAANESLASSTCKKSQLESAMEKAAAEVLELNSKLSVQSHIISSQENMIISLQKQIDFLKNRVTILESERDQFAKDNEMATNQLMGKLGVENVSSANTLQEMIASHLNSIESYKKQVFTFEAQIRALEEEIKGKNATAESLCKQLCDTESSYLEKQLELQQEVAIFKGQLRDSELQFSSELKLSKNQYENVRQQLDLLKLAEVDTAKQHSLQIAERDHKEKDFKKQLEAMRLQLQNALLSVESLKSQHASELLKKEQAQLHADNNALYEIARVKAELEKVKRNNTRASASHASASFVLQNFQHGDIVLLYADGLKTYKPFTTDHEEWIVAEDTLVCIHNAHDPAYRAMWSDNEKKAMRPARFVIAQVIQLETNDSNKSKLMTCEILRFFL